MAGITKSADITTTVREIDFVTSFQRNWDALREILGIARPIKKEPGSKLTYKTVSGTLESGAVAEGATIPYSKFSVTETAYGNITINKYKKGVSLEAIKDYGYDVAVQKTDDEFKYELTAGVMTKFYTFLNTGTLTGNYETFQMALAMAKGLVENKFKTIHRSATGAVAFINTLDFYEYLGTANVTVQTQYGFTYIKDFMGYNTIFLLSASEVARGTVLATPVDNIVMYYVDPADSDFKRAGLDYTVSGETNLIGYHTAGNYDTAVSDCFAITGITLFAEYLDGIAKVTFGSDDEEDDA